MKYLKKIILIPLVLCLFFSFSILSNSNSIKLQVATISYADSSDFKITNGVLTEYTGNATNITIPSSVKTIGKNVFRGNDTIKKVTIPSSVTTIDSYAFAYSSLSSVNIASSVTTIKNHAFFCTEVKSVTLPKNLKSFGLCVFNRCYSLESIFISSQNKYFTCVNGVLFNKSKTKLIQYPANKSGTTYTVPSSVTEIAPGGFSFSGLSKINLSKNLRTIGDCAFYKNDSLNYLVIPEGVKTLKADTFVLSRSLKYVQLPKSINSIDKDTFENGSGMWVGGTYLKGYIGSYSYNYATKYKIKFVPVGVISPSNFKVSLPSNTTIKSSWSKVSGASGYEVKYSTSSKFTSNTTKSITTTSSSKTLSPLKKKTTYYIKIRAYKSTSSNSKIYSSYSSVKSIKTK